MWNPLSPVDRVQNVIVDKDREERNLVVGKTNGDWTLSQEGSRQRDRKRKKKRQPDEEVNSPDDGSVPDPTRHHIDLLA